MPLDAGDQQTCRYASGFVVLPKRWTEERTLGWFNWYRRLSKDDKELPANSESMIRVSMIHRLKIKELAGVWGKSHF